MRLSEIVESLRNNGEWHGQIMDTDYDLTMDGNSCEIVTDGRYCSTVTSDTELKEFLAGDMADAMEETQESLHRAAVTFRDHPTANNLTAMQEIKMAAEVRAIDEVWAEDAEEYEALMGGHISLMEGVEYAKKMEETVHVEY